jgi:hypothetical protein
MKGWVKSVQKRYNGAIQLWQTILIIGLVCCLGTHIKVGDYSLWWVVMKITPGLMHFRLFVAFCNFLVFPVSIVLAVG